MTSNINLLGPIVREQGFTIMGVNAYESSGYSVKGAGDINNDGYADIIVGAPNAADNAGISYVIFGQVTTLCDVNLSNLSYTQEYSTSGGQGFSIFGSFRGTPESYYGLAYGGGQSGYSVSGIGDINGDGFSDIAIGAPGESSNAGTSYIIFGKESNFTDIYLESLTPIEGFSIIGVSGTDFDDYIYVSQGDKSGWSVSAAGDVNNDGYDDVIIGAPGANNEKGASYIIFGNKTEYLDNIRLENITIAQGFFITGANYGDKSGWSVSGAGDVDGDGKDDIIIGAPFANNQAGITYVIFGKETSSITNIELNNLDSHQGFSIYGEAINYNSGWSVSGAGDINNDGLADIVVGMPGARYSTGFSCVIFGTDAGFSNIDLTSLSISQGFFIYGAIIGGYSGYSVSGVKDINGDSFDDIAIGAPYIGRYVGVTYIILGKASGYTNIYLNSLTLSQGFSITGVNINGAFNGGESGWSVSGAGDFNNDGIYDLIIGAPQESSNLNGAGSSYIVLGQLSVYNIALSNFTSSNIAIIGSEKNVASGYVVSGAGDFNNDGFDDILIGAPDDQNNAGISYLIFGTANEFANNIGLATLSEKYGFSIIGTNGDGSGLSVSGAGDINGDGYDDIIIGAPYANSSTGDTSDSTGISYVIFGKANNLNNIYLNNLSLEQGFSIYGSNYGDQIGKPVSRAGDVNGDGYDDIIIGAQGVKLIYILFGKASGFSNVYLSNLTLIDGFTITASLYCSAVSGIGDINGDGYDDIIIGTAAKCVGYVVYGAKNFVNINLANLTSTQGFSIIGAAITDAYTSVSGAGDVNNDGYDDIIIGAPTEGDEAGISYVIFGKPTVFNNIYLSSLTIAQGFSITGSIASGQSGCSVSGAGDVNNDGYDDVVIGAPYATNSGGIAYVVFGKASGFSDISLTANLASTNQGFSINGAYSGDFTGGSVSGAGDVNGDGISDLIIGAQYANFESGISYLIFSTPAPTSAPTYMPTNPEHKSPTFWDSYGNIIIATVVPSLAAVTTVFFSKQICFNVLDKWAVTPGTNTFSNNPSSNRWYIQKIIYNGCEKLYLKDYVMHNEVRDKHNEAQEKRGLIEQTTGKKVEMSDLDLSETKNSDLIATDNPLFSQRVTEENSQVDDIEKNSKTPYQIRETSFYGGEIRPGFGSDFSRSEAKVVLALYQIKYDDPILNHPQISYILGETYKNGGIKEVNELLSRKNNLADKINIDKSDIVLLKDNFPDSKQAEFSSDYTNDLVNSLLDLRKLIEYLPLLKYLNQVYYPLVENNLPESVKNINLPEILDSKVFLFTAHLGFGSIGAMLLPQETVNKGLIGTVAASTAYGVRLASSHYLAEQKQEFLSHDNPMDAFEVTKYCVSTILAYTAPTLATCALAQLVTPGYSCADLDISTKLSLAGAECYSVYKAVQATTITSTSDIVVPYITDVVAGVTAYTNGYSPMSIVATVVTTDWMSRLAMDFASSKVKENYIDPILGYASEFYTCIYENINQIIEIPQEF